MAVVLTHSLAGSVEVSRLPRRPDWSDGWLQPQPTTASGRAMGAEPVRAVGAATLEWPGMAATESAALAAWHPIAALGPVTIAGLGAELTVLLGDLDVIEVTPDRHRVTLQIEVLA